MSDERGVAEFTNPVLQGLFPRVTASRFAGEEQEPEEAGVSQNIRLDR